MPQFCDRLLNT